MNTPIGEIKIRNQFDAEVIKEVVLDRGYERWGNIEIKGNVLDCGAHIGAFTRLALSYPEVKKVIAVEPDPENFKLLQENTKGYKNVTLINKAISIETSPILKIDPERSELNKLVNYGEGLLVDGVTLNELITEPINLLKMDIEGSEYDAFLYLHPTKYKLIEQITMEYHNGGHNMAKLILKLKEYDFEMVWIGGQDFGHIQLKNRRFK